MEIIDTKEFKELFKEIKEFFDDKKWYCDENEVWISIGDEEYDRSITFYKDTSNFESHLKTIPWQFTELILKIQKMLRDMLENK